MLAKAPLLMPDWKLGKPGGTVELPINLHGVLNIDELEGNLVVDDEGVSIEVVEGTPRARAGGYRVLSEREGNKAFFRIQRKQAGGGPLPHEPLMEAKLKLGPASGVLYRITVDVLKMYPRRAICLGNNVVIVPAL